MRYCTWRLTWDAEHQYGVGPEQTVADHGSRLEASSWVDPTVESGTILGYLDGDIDVAILADWNVVELDQVHAVMFAQNIDENAYPNADGVIITFVNEEGERIDPPSPKPASQPGIVWVWSEMLNYWVGVQIGENT